MDEPTQLGQFRIVGLLGAGGMGKVYRAVDTRLGRQVAIKVLATELDETEALQRFEREARVLAALNHPNVATLFSFEEADGVSYLVMELVEGAPLSVRLREGPLAVPEAIRLAGQVAEALQAAHERNVVHRDLKPANVMVLPTGVAKLLDFGIAALRDQTAAGGPAEVDATAPFRLTGEHQIVGTPAYMSPEQIRGQEVDARADIWAFGCLLYEMLAGRRLFDRETVADTMAAILEHEADLEGLPAETPPAIRSMLRRCLERGIDARARDIWHVRIELEESSRPLSDGPTERVCLRCGQSNMAGHQFCGHCGSSLSAECPACGIETAPGAAFCGACGGRLEADASVEAPAAQPRIEPAATPATVAEPAATSTALSAGERRYVTILDLALDGYSELLENLAPDRLGQITEAVGAVVRAAAADHGGAVLRVEDATATLVFGVPVSQEDDARRAVAAALAAIEAVAELETGVASGGPTMRAGLATGACVTRLESSGGYSVVGDPARSAGRLLDQASAGRVLIAPETARLVRHDYETEAGDPVTLPGATHPLEPRYVTGLATAGDRTGAGNQRLTAFAGRDDELAELERALADAIEGSGRFVTVVGEAGLGKSRLLSEFARRAGDSGRVVYGRSQARGENTPYLPFLEMLHTLLPAEAGGAEPDRAIADQLTAIDSELEDLLPVYLHLLAVPSDRYPLPSHLEDRHLSTAIQQALAAIVTQASQVEPLVLLLEDWHWSDGASREIVRQLGVLLPEFPVLVVVTYRPEYSEDWSRLPHHAAIHLTPLRVDASAAIMQSVLEARSIPSDLAEFVRLRTGGNPFFIEEVCRALVEQESLTIDEGQVVLHGRLQDLQLPETIQALVRTRLDRQEPYVLEVARVASVIGRDFRLELLRHVLGEDTRLEPALLALQDAGLVRQVRVVPDVAYRFQHVLIRDVAYDMLLLHQRKALHGLVAEAIEATCGDRVEVQSGALAEHFGQAGQLRKAIRYGEAEAERSRSVSQFAESVAMLERVVAWCQSLPSEEQDPDFLIDVLMRQERMYETLGRRDLQRQAIDEMLASIDASEPSAQLTEAHLRLGDFYATTSKYDEARTTLEPALAWSRALGDQELERRVYRSLGFLEWQGGDNELAREMIDRAIAIDEARDEETELAHDLTNYAATLRHTGDVERALELLQRAMEIYERRDLEPRLIEALHVGSTLYRQVGDLDKSIELLERARDLGRSKRDTIHLHWELGNLGNIHLELGNHEEAMAAFEEAIHWSRRSGFAHGLAMSLRAMGDGLLAIGRAGEALPYLREAAEQFAGMSETGNEANTWEDIAHAYAQLGHLADATAARERALRQQRQVGDREAELRVLLTIARHEREHDVAAAQAALEAAAEVAGDVGNGLARGDALNSLGILHWQAGRYDEALAAYKASLQVFEGLDDKPHRGLVLNSLGVVLRALKRDDEARTRFQEALEVNREAGERLLEGHSLAGLGDVAAEAGNVEEALGFYADALRLRESLGDRPGAARMLLKSAEVASAAGDADGTFEYAARALEIARCAGDDELIERIRRLGIE